MSKCLSLPGSARTLFSGPRTLFSGRDHGNLSLSNDGVAKARLLRCAHNDIFGSKC
jgi:hypothetical protein